MFMRLLVAVLCAIALGPLLATSRVAADGLTPIPCEAGPFTPADPSFSALPGATAYSGLYPGGSYRFEVPATWNGELIMYMHGTATGPTLNASVPSAIREFAVANGYATGASSYRCNDYKPGIGLTDTILLKDSFVALTGKSAPTKHYLVGSSMGGFQTQLGMHVYPTMFDGALDMCGMNANNWDNYVAFGAAAEYLTGLKFTDPSAAGTAATQAAMIQILGLPGTVAQPLPGTLTEKGLQLASVMINMTGGPRPFAVEGLVPPFRGLKAFQFIISGATLAGSTTPGNLTRGNANAQYFVDPGLGETSSAIQNGVRRVSPNTAIYSQYEETRPLSGNIQRPLLTLYNTADYVVTFSNSQALQRAVDSAGKSNLLVQRIIRAAGHCGFSDTEVKTALADLTKWVHTGARPDGDNVLASDLRDAGRKFTSPLRAGDPGTIRIPLDAEKGRSACQSSWQLFLVFRNQGMCIQYVNTAWFAK
jgi:pimeloyl-ACP methyl ester carboxylesterase